MFPCQPHEKVLRIGGEGRKLTPRAAMWDFPNGTFKIRS